MRYDPNQEARRFDSLVDNCIEYFANRLPSNPLNIVNLTSKQQNVTLAAKSLREGIRRLERELAEIEFANGTQDSTQREILGRLHNSYQSLKLDFIAEEAIKREEIDFSKVS